MEHTNTNRINLKPLIIIFVDGSSKIIYVDERDLNGLKRTLKEFAIKEIRIG